MNTDDGGAFVQELIRRVLMVILAVVWWLRFEQPSGDALFLTPVADGIVIVALAFIGNMRGLAWQDGLLWLILSRRMHIDAYNNLEALQAVMQISWVLWGAAWAMAGNERNRYLLLLYHGGLAFDAGMARSFGLGMSVGWEAAPLTLMFLSAAVRRALLFRDVSRFPAGVVPVFFGLLFLVAIHKTGPAAHLTCAVISTLAAMVLFFATSPADPESMGGEGAMLALGGIALCLAAVQLGVADAPGIDIFLRKRLFAGGLHPNVIGVWSLLMLILTGSRASWNIVPASVRRVVHGGVALLYVTMLFCAGSRLVLLTGILSVLIALVAGRRSLGGSWTLIVPAGTAALALGIWRIGQSGTLGEWYLNERFFIWSAAWQNIKQALWTGHGVLSYGELPQMIDPDRGVWVYDWVYPHTHQLMLELLLWGGLPLLLAAAAAVVAWLRATVAGNMRSAALAIGMIGVADFVHFTPAMMLLVVAVWFLGVSASRPIGVEIDRRWKYPILLLGAAAMFGTMNGATARARYQEALEALYKGDGGWRQSLDVAVNAAPARIDLRLQRLLLDLSTGAEPDETCLAIARAIRVARPLYYLPWFIEGRMLELAGRDSAALDAYLKSLDLEPRDLMGIRWSRAALTARRLGKDATLYAWRAIQRGAWGSACILDHPVYGDGFRTSLSTRLATFLVENPRDVLQACQAASALAERDVEPLSLPPLPGQGGPIPEGLLDYQMSVEMRIASRSAGAASVVASAAGNSDQYLVSRLHALCAMADSLGLDDVIASVAPRLRSVWNYRNKNDEDLWLAWWLAKASDRLHQPDQVLGFIDRLNTMDPANPWILEMRGDASRMLGDLQGAQESYAAALRAVPMARLDPFFASGPRELYIPAGDQWSYAFERAFRRFDDDARVYRGQEWNALSERLEGKAAGK